MANRRLQTEVEICNIQFAILSASEDELIARDRRGLLLGLGLRSVMLFPRTVNNPGCNS